MMAPPPLFRAAVPGTSIALRHRPPASVTTNACSWPQPTPYSPPAPQPPAAPHDTEPATAPLPAHLRCLPARSGSPRPAARPPAAGAAPERLWPPPPVLGAALPVFFNDPPPPEPATLTPHAALPKPSR